MILIVNQVVLFLDSPGTKGRLKCPQLICITIEFRNKTIVTPLELDINVPLLLFTVDVVKFKSVRTTSTMKVSEGMFI